MTREAQVEIPRTEQFLLALEERPWNTVYRMAIGFAAFPLYRSLWGVDAPGWSLACFFLAGLFLLRLVPAVLRRLLPFSAETQEVWRERRRLGKRYDSYQWRKLLWIGLGIGLSVLFSRSAGPGAVGVVVALSFIVPGLAGWIVWRRVTGKNASMSVVTSA
jgi:hypothetical protein